MELKASASPPLLPQGRCDVNLRNNRNQAPLHLAVTQGHLEMVQLLVSEGADVNSEDEDGDTAMHIILEREHLVSVLVEQQPGREDSLFSKVGGALGPGSVGPAFAFWGGSLPVRKRKEKLKASGPPCSRPSVCVWGSGR